MFEVEPPQAGHSNALVSESTMEQLGSLFEGEASPLFESFEAEQKINVFLIKHACFLPDSDFLGRLESLGAEILNLVASEVESAGNG